ncbi:hypothetical protein J5N97_023625 [Dioscorea zingiberensis]|uniref:Branchpoint-bridging protein n=1 Tax=Dioscorea zingiberensis TaxID=325984 RepID=A0A9D5H829_9LILI|nr:hypothetical protein J5N97_023625 [Dioscorea zingiberensis]
MGKQNVSVDLSLTDDSGCDEDVDVEPEEPMEEPNEEGLGEDEQNEGEFCEERSGDGLKRDACEEKQGGVYEESNEEEVYEEEPNEEEVYEDEPNEESYEEDPDEEVNYEGEPTEEAIYGEESIEEEIYKEETEDDSSEASAAQSSFESNKDEEDCHLKFMPVYSGKHVMSVDALGDHLQKSPIEGNTSGEKKRSADALGDNSQKRQKKEINSELQPCARSSLTDFEDKSKATDKITMKEKEKSGSSGKKRRSRCDAGQRTGDDAGDAGDAARKKRKTRWESDDAVLKMLGPLKLPDFVKGLVADTDCDPEIKKLNSELLEISRKLHAQEIIDDRPVAERSPSPPPIFNEAGIRLNTRNARYHVKLIERRQMIISDLVKRHPTFRPPSDYRPSKLYKKLYIPVKEYPKYNFVGLIIGPRGNTQKRMEKESGAKILIRGVGSAKDGRLKQEVNADPWGDYEDLHVRIEADTQDSLNAAVKMVENLLVPVEDGVNEHKQAQLLELAKLREDGSKPVHTKSVQANTSCNICGDFLADIGDGGMSPSSSSSVPTPTVPCTASQAPVSLLAENGIIKKEIDEANIYIASLPQSVDDKRLIELFSPFGPIRTARVIKDKQTGLSKGYGFVKFNDAMSASNAIAQMNGCKLEGKTLAVRVAGRPSPLLTSSLYMFLRRGPRFNHLPAYPGPQVISHLKPKPKLWPGPPATFSSAQINPIGGQTPGSFGCTTVLPKFFSSGIASPTELAQFPGYQKRLDLPDGLMQPAPLNSLPSAQLHSTFQA